MVYTTLDIICRRALLENKMPIHYYAEYLFNASTCLRELTIEALKVINTKNLPVNERGEVDLPDDFQDDVMLSLGAGAVLRPIPHKTSLNPLQIHNATTGAFEVQANPATVNSGNLYFPFVGYSWFWNVSDWGEPTGRVFGATGGNPAGYQVFKERRQIQMYGGFTSGSIILQYISNGQSVDNASMVDNMAFATIQSYIDWKSSPNAKNEFSPEGRMYYNQRRKLRARLSDLTHEDIRNVIHSSYTAAIKN